MKDIQGLKDELFNLVPKNISKKEEEELTRYIDYIVSSMSPVYNYVKDISDNEEKIKDVISIIDHLKSGKKNDN